MAKKTINDIPQGTSHPADATEISLSQAILGTLDAISKAQVHAARSFLNFLMQLGYEDTQGREGQEPPPYTIPITFQMPDSMGNPVKHCVEIPTLALIPINPLSIDSADIKLAFRVESLAKFGQMRGTVKEAPEQRPWYLVENPISLRGSLAAQPAETSASSSAVIEVSVKLGRVPTPEALQRILSAIGNTGLNTAAASPPTSGTASSV